MDAYRNLLGDVLRLAGEIYFRRVEAELGKFAEALNQWLHELFAHPRPDWREGLARLFAQQEAEGRIATPESRQALVALLEDWAKTVEWNTPSSTIANQWFSEENERPTVQPGPSFSYTHVPSDDAHPVVRQAASGEPRSPAGRGDQSQFSRESEEIVSEATGVPRNQAPPRQTIPGSGPGGFRIPDFPVRGLAGSVRQRGTIIEVKASRGTSFGELSGRSRQQIDDAVEFVLRLRDKASLVKDPAIKALLKKAHVEVFSDLAQPKSGVFLRLIKTGVLEWKPIPRTAPASTTVARGAGSVIPSTARSIGKPGIGAAASIALGVVASLAEAGVADAAYRDAATALKDLLNQIARNGEAGDADWQYIDKKLQEIANLKLSSLAQGWEVITYGQGSRKERQALDMILLATELAEKFGYENNQTWGDVFAGSFGRFVKKQ